MEENSPHRTEAASCLLAQQDITMVLPVAIGDYTDFYASVHHAANVGALFRPDNPLLPNYKWVPIGYHGRASTIVVSGTGIRRPYGQCKRRRATEPHFGSCRTPRLRTRSRSSSSAWATRWAKPFRSRRPSDHIFGLCLVNDWSARDIQSWEYQPLGPFLAKSFATTISPWVVTAEALAPFRVPAFAAPAGDPQPLPYLLTRTTSRAAASI